MFHLLCLLSECTDCISTRDEVPEADSGQSDDHEVEGLQEGPALHLLEHHGGHGQEDEAANQDGENGRDEAHRGRPDLTSLMERQRKAQ